MFLRFPVFFDPVDLPEPTNLSASICPSEVQSGIGRIVIEHPERTTRLTAGAISMSAVVWTWLRGLFGIALTWERGLRARSPKKRKTVPALEPLEAMALLSTGAHPIGRAAWVCSLYGFPCLFAAYLVFLRRDVAGG